MSFGQPGTSRRTQEPGDGARESYFGPRHTTTIAPRRWGHLDLSELWAYRELLATFASRDIRVRYKQTLLGAGWALLRPLLATAIFAVVFGRLAKLPSEGAPYPLFVLAGLVPWTFFASALASGAEALVGSQALISKVYFPRLVVPLSQLGVALLDLLISIGMLIAATYFYGAEAGWRIVLLAPLVVLLVASTLGPVVLLSALTVAYRDFRHISPFLLQIWMYATPVVFPASLVPERLRLLFYLNPMAGPVEGFRAVILGRAVDWSGMTVSFSVACVILVAAALYFGRVQERFADIV